eukprot:370819_1
MPLIRNLKSISKLPLVRCCLFKISYAQKSILLEPPNTTNMNSYDAVKKIKNLQKSNDQNMVTKAFQIYNNLDETQRNEFVIQSLLTCCKIMQNKKPMDTMKVVNHIKNSIINTHNNVNSKNLLMGIYLRCND